MLVQKGYGKNVDPSANRSIILDGHRKAHPFPVFATEHLEDILWTLGWDDITSKVNELSSKKQRLAWLMSRHSYLPDKTLAELSGAGLRTVERRRQAAQSPAITASVT